MILSSESDGLLLLRVLDEALFLDATPQNIHPLRTVADLVSFLTFQGWTDFRFTLSIRFFTFAIVKMVLEIVLLVSFVLDMKTRKRQWGENEFLRFEERNGDFPTSESDSAHTSREGREREREEFRKVW